jgi:SAM-dependent methyltransferase
MKDKDFLEEKEPKRVKDVWEKKLADESISDEDFVKFFDLSDTYENVRKLGYIDFYGRILTPDMYKILNSDIREKTALEIGFGAGRLIEPATRVFKDVIGVDIHGAFDKTSKILERNQCGNHRLIHREQIKNIDDKSIDFIFSFIVFQHFEKWEEAVFYLKHIKRILKDDGCGIIYFGINSQTSDNFIESGDSLFEERGYSLIVNPNFAIEEMKNYVKTIECTRGNKKPWGGGMSNQFYIKFVSAESKLF